MLDDITQEVKKISDDPDYSGFNADEALEVSMGMTRPQHIRDPSKALSARQAFLLLNDRISNAMVGDAMASEITAAYSEFKKIVVQYKDPAQPQNADPLSDMLR